MTLLLLLLFYLRLFCQVHSQKNNNKITITIKIHNLKSFRHDSLSHQKSRCELIKEAEAEEETDSAPGPFLPLNLPGVGLERHIPYNSAATKKGTGFQPFYSQSVPASIVLQISR